MVAFYPNNTIFYDPNNFTLEDIRQHILPSTAKILTM